MARQMHFVVKGRVSCGNRGRHILGSSDATKTTCLRCLARRAEKAARAVKVEDAPKVFSLLGATDDDIADFCAGWEPSTEPEVIPAGAGASLRRLFPSLR